MMRYDNLDDWITELNYMLVGANGDQLHELYKSDKTEEFADLAAVIEEFIIDGDGDMKNLAVIGILEGIQNVWIREKLEPEIITKYFFANALKVIFPKPK